MSLQKSNVEIPTFFIGLACERWLGQEGGALLNEISPLIKEGPELLLSFLHVEYKGVWDAEEGPRPTITLLDSQSLEP